MAASDLRPPVLGGPKLRRFAAPFIGGSPAVLLASVAVQNPFVNPDFSKPFDVISSPPQIIQRAYGNFYPNPIPFAQYDWSKPVDVPGLPPPPIERNPLIFSEVPFVPVDYSKPFGVANIPPQFVYPNLALTTVVVQAPFFNPDFSKPYFLKPLPSFVQAAYGNFYQNPIPFGPYDWSAKPGQFPPRAPDQIYTDLVLLQAPLPPPPFIPVDYSKPFFPQIRFDQTKPTNINIFLNPIPFGPFDWSARPQLLPRTPPPQRVERNPLIFSEVPPTSIDLSSSFRVRSAPQLPTAPYNILLLTQISPFSTFDFSRPRSIRAAPQLASPPYNLALNTPVGPQPFLNIDWSRPFAIRLQQPQPQPNLTLRLPPPPPAPLRPFDWSKPYAIRPVVPQSQPNLTLYLPPPPFIGIPSLCYSRDIPVASFTDTDVAAGFASGEDEAGFTAKANDSPSGQDWSGAGYMSQYEIDTTIELQAIFTNALTGVYADPTTVKLYILDPAGIQTTQIWPGGAIIRDSLGHFHYIMTPAKSGNWTYKWQGSGAAVATSPDTIFTVNASALIPG